MTKKKLPATNVEAFKFYVDYMPDWFMSMVTTNDVVLTRVDPDDGRAFATIKNMGETKVAHYGEYIARDKNGKIYIYPADQFHSMFRPIEYECCVQDDDV